MKLLFVQITFLIFCLLVHENIGSMTKEGPAVSKSDDLLVHLPDLGRLMGSLTQTARTNETIYQFLGVKYAESPSGKKRFKAPLPISKWDGIKNADKFDQRCPQLGVLKKMSEAEQKSRDLEDCLSLCVYSKNLNESAKRPVIVYINVGGFFDGGSDTASPAYYLERDIVFVVPQFRIDSIGLLSTQSNEIPGNAALLDVILSLEWIQKNIMYFGGDHKRVTLVGQSSGADLITALAFSPKVPNHLFQRIITQSSSSFARWIYDSTPVKAARAIGKKLGVPENASLDELNQTLLGADVLKLLEATQQANTENEGNSHSPGRSIIIGGPTNLLPQTPYEIAKSGHYRKDLDVLTGVTKNDGSLPTAEMYDFLEIKGLLNNTEHIKREFIPMLARLLYVDDDAGAFVGTAMNHYWTPEQIESGTFRQIANGLIDFLGTIVFKGSSLRLAQMNARFNPDHTFLYTYDYRAQFTRFGYGEDTSKYPFDGGVHHSDDNLNFFPYPKFAAHLNERDTEISKKMVNLWTSFAATGRPKATFDGQDDVEWLPFTDATGPYLHIDKKFLLGKRYTDEFIVTIREN